MWYDRAGAPISMDEWVRLLGNPEYKRVAEDTVGDVWVSTIWLGLNHNWYPSGVPLLFETMLWRGTEIVRDPTRYHSEEAALAGHRAIVNELRQRERENERRERMTNRYDGAEDIETPEQVVTYLMDNYLMDDGDHLDEPTATALASHDLAWEWIQHGIGIRSHVNFVGDQIAAHARLVEADDDDFEDDEEEDEEEDDE
jgi:hypothetical protein